MITARNLSRTLDTNLAQCVSLDKNVSLRSHTSCDVPIQRTVGMGNLRKGNLRKEDAKWALEIG